MPFQFSQATVSGTVIELADSVGASADTEMLGRAFKSLNAGIKHFNNLRKWNWLWTEAPPVYVSAPFSVTAVTASAGAASAAAPPGHGIAVDDLVVGTNFLAGTRVSATAASGFGVYAAPSGYSGTATADITVIRDMYAAPSDLKANFTAKLLSSSRPLSPVHRRLMDRSGEPDPSPGSPEGYDEFALWQRSKIRLVPAPGSADVLQVRYHRAMATASASGASATLDIPSDYDPYLIAFSKWHFLMDKGEGRKDQATTWYSFAERGLQQMVRDDTDRPDIAYGFVPGAYESHPHSDNSTRWIPWDYSAG